MLSCFIYVLSFETKLKMLKTWLSRFWRAHRPSALAPSRLENFKKSLISLLVGTFFEQAEEPCCEEAEAKEEQAEEDGYGGAEAHACEL